MREEWLIYNAFNLMKKCFHKTFAIPMVDLFGHLKHLAKLVFRLVFNLKIRIMPQYPNYIINFQLQNPQIYI